MGDLVGIGGMGKLIGDGFAFVVGWIDAVGLLRFVDLLCGYALANSQHFGLRIGTHFRRFVENTLSDGSGFCNLLGAVGGYCIFQQTPFQRHWFDKKVSTVGFHTSLGASS